MARAERPVALVTGSATGVGRSCVLRFARAGYDVIVNYSRSETEARETLAEAAQAGARTLLAQCDVGHDVQVQNMLRSVEAEFGRLDVLVNNAATTWFIEHQDLDALSEDKWDRILQVNLKGPFFCTRAAVPLLRKSGGGAIVNVSSVAGVSGEGSSIAYAASKGALNTMTRSLARALGPNIRVNAVCPGPIETRWLKAVMSDDELRQRTSKFPLQRAAQPEDIADTIFYLAAETTLTTGQCLVVDGGRTM